MGSCYGKPKKEPTNDTPGEKGITTFGYPIQVGNRKGMKWKSTIAEGDPIPVVDDKDQFWWLKRDEKDSLWSFYTVSSDKVKLYVSYNGKDPNDPKVTLERADDSDSSKDRRFRALPHPSGRLLLRPEPWPEKVIGIEQGVLELINPEGRQEEEHSWVIDLDVKEGDVQDGITVTLKTPGQTQWVLHAEVGDKIPVGDPEEEFTMKNGTQTHTFTFSYGTEQNILYIAKENEETTDMAMCTEPNNPSLKEFIPVNLSKITGIAYKSAACDQYMGIGDENLALVDDAVGWDFGDGITRLMFCIKGKEVVFPSPPNVSTDQKQSC